MHRDWFLIFIIEAAIGFFDIKVKCSAKGGVAKSKGKGGSILSYN